MNRSASIFGADFEETADVARELAVNMGMAQAYIRSMQRDSDDRQDAQAFLNNIGMVNSNGALVMHRPQADDGSAGDFDDSAGGDADSDAAHREQAGAEQIAPPGAPPAAAAPSGPTGREYVAPPVHRAPVERWGLPEAHTDCIQCEWDSAVSNNSRADVVAERFLRWIKFIERLARNDTINDFQRAERAAHTYNETVLPVLRTVLDRAREQGATVNEKHYQECHPLLCYEHNFCTSGHYWTSRKRPHHAMRDTDTDADPDAPDDGGGGKEFVPHGGDILPSLISIYRNAIETMNEEQFYYEDTTPSGRTITKTDQATSTMMDRKAAVLINLIKLHDARQARRGEAPAGQTGEVRAPSLSAANVLKRVSNPSGVQSFGPESTRRTRPGDLALFQRTEQQQRQ